METLNVDRLAQHGVRFTDAHAVASTSTPSRYSMLTGEYCFRRPGTDIATGDAGMIIRPEQYTLADMFKSCGYTTGAVGKCKRCSQGKMPTEGIYIVRSNNKAWKVAL